MIKYKDGSDLFIKFAIANELAEANRLKRIELDIKLMESEKSTLAEFYKHDPELLEDQATGLIP